MMNRMLVAAEVFVGGAAIMVVELLGVRLVSPYFGTGMHVWAALISVAPPYGRGDGDERLATR